MSGKKGLCVYCGTVYILKDEKLPEHKPFGVKEPCCGSGKIPRRLVVENEYVKNPEYS